MSQNTQFFVYLFCTQFLTCKRGFLNQCKNARRSNSSTPPAYLPRGARSEGAFICAPLRSAGGFILEGDWTPTNTKLSQLATYRGGSLIFFQDERQKKGGPAEHCLRFLYLMSLCQTFRIRKFCTSCRGGFSYRKCKARSNTKKRSRIKYTAACSVYFLRTPLSIIIFCFLPSESPGYYPFFFRRWFILAYFILLSKPYFYSLSVFLNIRSADIYLSGSAPVFWHLLFCSRLPSAS